MENLPLELTKLLYMRFSSIYGEKFNRSHTSDQFVQVWWNEWSCGLAGIEPVNIKIGLDYCRTNLEWPPSIAEFRRHCEVAAGIPTIADALQMAIRADFSHPIVYIAYNMVGSWAMKNSKEADLNKKFQEAYTSALNKFRLNPQACYDALPAPEELKKLEPPSKIPTPAEIKTFKEHLADWNARAAAEQAKPKGDSHPEYDPDKIHPGHLGFDERLFNERKRYLIGLDEYQAGTLNRADWYDRTIYLREIMADEYLKKLGTNPSSKSSYASTKRSKANTRYKNWMSE